jgi:hypothetical protein
MADARLGAPQFRRGGAKAAGVGNGDQHLKLIELRLSHSGNRNRSWISANYMEFRLARPARVRKMRFVGHLPLKGNSHELAAAGYRFDRD